MSKFKQVFNQLDIDEFTKYDIAVKMWNAAIQSVLDLVKNNQYIPTRSANVPEQMEFDFETSDWVEPS